jgi:hypothetical protein
MQKSYEIEVSKFLSNKNQKDLTDFSAQGPSGRYGLLIMFLTTKKACPCNRNINRIRL